MNTTTRYKLLLAAACVGLPASGLFAQTPAATPTSTPSVSVPASTAPAASTTPGKHGERERLAVLTPAERQELKAAHEKAMLDPAVKAAEPTKETDKKGFRKTVREAMLRADPGVAAILEKMRAAGHGKKEL